MFLGRYQLGDVIRVVAQCRDGSGSPAWPALPPTVEFWQAGHRPNPPRPIPARDFAAVGLFEGLFAVDSRFTLGTVTGLVRGNAGVPSCRAFCFEVVPGGDARGAVVALTDFVLPTDHYLVMQTDGGILTRGKNPRLP